MNFKSFLASLKRHYAMFKGGEYYIDYLRAQGITIGENCTVGAPRTMNIDCTRPCLIEVGNQVRLNTGLTLMTHDFTTLVFKNKYGEFLPSSGKIKIGNNVYFGRNCTVLKGVTIGDNCIVGFGSLVMRDVPANSVVAGVPAKVICSVDDYYKKRQEKSLEEAFKLAREIKAKYKRRPEPRDFREEFVFFVSGNEIDKYPEIPIEFQLSYMGNCYDTWVKNHKARFNSFDEFLKAADVD